MSGCVDTKNEDFRNPLEFFSHYSSDNCLFECSVRYIYNKCNCTHFFHPGMLLFTSDQYWKKPLLSKTCRWIGLPMFVLLQDPSQHARRIQRTFVWQVLVVRKRQYQLMPSLVIQFYMIDDNLLCL